MSLRSSYLKVGSDVATADLTNNQVTVDDQTVQVEDLFNQLKKQVVAETTVHKLMRKL